jgi:hypothetical protein
MGVYAQPHPSSKRPATPHPVVEPGTQPSYPTIVITSAGPALGHGWLAGTAGIWLGGDFLGTTGGPDPLTRKEEEV